MSEVPKIGGWYQDKIGTRVVVIGMASKFRVVVEHECGIIGSLGDWNGWRHLPGCTGFSWQEPCNEVFPQYYAHHSEASIGRHSFVAIRRRVLSRYGKTGPKSRGQQAGLRKATAEKITMSDAISRLDNSRGYDKAVEVPLSREMELIEKLQKRVDRLEAAERRERAMCAVQ